MFSTRIKLKNTFKGIKDPLAYHSKRQSSNEALNFKKALVVSKLSHYAFERHRHKDLSDGQLEHLIRNRGSDFDKMMYYHHLHEGFETKFLETLKQFGTDVRVVNKLNYNKECVKWADIIFPTGGDGTFLLAASGILNNKKVCVGFNSDPNRSEGCLLLPKKFSANIKEAIEKLRSGHFKWLMRNRIRTTIIGQKDKQLEPLNLYTGEQESDLECSPVMESNEWGRTLPYLALNEVFIGETLSARVSSLGMWVDGSEQKTNLKCSGVCICTGTGSSSWNLSINRLPVQSVAELLRLLDIEATEGKDSLATVLAKIYNNNLVFSPDKESMCYTIRDLISAGVWPQPKGIKSRGFTKTLKVKSKCVDACLVIDGNVSFTFNDGSEAILRIHPEDALRTVIIDD